MSPAPLLTLDLVQTLALAGCVLFLGYGVRHLLPALARVNIPAPVVGGLLAACLLWWGRSRGLTLVQLDTSLQAPLMIAFFTTIGFGASLALLRAGGPAVAVFLGISTVLAVGQNLLGGALAPLVGQHPLLGVLAGSVTLTGGPATGLAFAPLFEKAGVAGAATLAVTAAMGGIVSGGLLGGPLGTWLIRRHALRSETPRLAIRGPAPSAGDLVTANEPEPPAADVPAGEDPGGHTLLKALVAILVAMWVGSWLSAGFTRLGLTLPAYIGAMLVAAVLRNLDDATGWLRLSHRLLDDLGNAALALFLALALTTLKLWELAGLALPLAILLAAQVALVALACLPVYRLMGRDYDAAVMSGGFCGFMLGTTANAMANMGALVERYGPAPRAYLVVPLVGAFFIDFTNALLITAFLNFWR